MSSFEMTVQHFNKSGSQAEKHSLRRCSNLCFKNIFNDCPRFFFFSEQKQQSRNLDMVRIVWGCETHSTKVIPGLDSGTGPGIVFDFPVALSSRLLSHLNVSDQRKQEKFKKEPRDPGKVMHGGSNLI